MVRRMCITVMHTSTQPHMFSTTLAWSSPCSQSLHTPSGSSAKSSTRSSPATTSDSKPTAIFLSTTPRSEPCYQSPPRTAYGSSANSSTTSSLATTLLSDSHFSAQTLSLSCKESDFSPDTTAHSLLSLNHLSFFILFTRSIPHLSAGTHPRNQQTLSDGHSTPTTTLQSRHAVGGCVLFVEEHRIAYYY